MQALASAALEEIWFESKHAAGKDRLSDIDYLDSPARNARLFDLAFEFRSVVGAYRERPHPLEEFIHQVSYFCRCLYPLMRCHDRSLRDTAP